MNQSTTLTQLKLYSVTHHDDCIIYNFGQHEDKNILLDLDAVCFFVWSFVEIVDNYYIKLGLPHRVKGKRISVDVDYALMPFKNKHLQSHFTFFAKDKILADKEKFVDRFTKTLCNNNKTLGRLYPLINERNSYNYHLLQILIKVIQDNNPKN